MGCDWTLAGQGGTDDLSNPTSYTTSSAENPYSKTLYVFQDAITYPIQFSAYPKIFASIYTKSGNSTIMGGTAPASYSSATKSGVRLNVSIPYGGGTPSSASVMWVAVSW